MRRRGKKYRKRRRKIEQREEEEKEEDKWEHGYEDKRKLIGLLRGSQSGNPIFSIFPPCLKSR